MPLTLLSAAGAWIFSQTSSAATLPICYPRTLSVSPSPLPSPVPKSTQGVWVAGKQSRPERRTPTHSVGLCLGSEILAGDDCNLGY